MIKSQLPSGPPPSSTATLLLILLLLSPTFQVIWAGLVIRFPLQVLILLTLWFWNVLGN